MGYNLYYYLDLLTVTAFAVTVKRLYITVAYGENQRSTCEAKVKSFKSIQIYQIYFVRILKK